MAKPRAKPPAPSPEEAERACLDDLGRAVREARRAREWTQVELATRAELSSNYVARLERGEVSPSLWVAHRLARAIGIGLDALVAPAATPPPLARTKFARRHSV